ncbi:formate dehydrogenase accessory protein FdhE [Paenirhodobacter populi]|uniref:Protein FdhE homolog n=1 Tax=Paenirhodobacter populi TaxID=2306993 RepID=A0A443JL96_9RHOB|nr:formate dehydrogenase accessory protein FdhE [Sinirhodobacter populi]RWR20786.1 formate dehydrogenase accessory protein FdhE [Sinirhodobacter populi]
MTTELKPDPSVIGGVPVAPFALLPEPERLFAKRAARFAFLAQSSNLAPYLSFLGDLTQVQARLVPDLPPPALPDAARIEVARAARMPPIDRQAAIADPVLHETLDRLCAAAAAIDMPAPARQALEAVSLAPREDRDWLLGNVLTDTIPADSVAPHLFAAAAAQVHMARIAATLDVAQLVPIRTGICPCCGGRAATSSVIGLKELENVRYAACATCATQWNEVRIKCLCCGSTKGLSYRSAETAKATVKAETCDECQSWVKIFYTLTNPAIEPIADDVGSLGLDLMMKETAYRRGGFDPYLTGY